MTEQNGGGVALLDFDGDGYLDIFFVNGSHFDHPAQQADATNRMFRAVGDLVYEDVTRLAGLEAFGFGMGIAAADYDNDGFTDLFVCYYGKNRLWHNNGDGTFDEVTQAAGVGDDRWSASAAFADLDGDGFLDLYVTNYVQYSRDDPPCHTGHKPRPVHISCGPVGRSGQADVLFRNLADGRFEDVSETAGVALTERGKGLAVQIVDLDEDGRLDIYVANDTTHNFLFRNKGKLRFEEIAVPSGVAFGDRGSSESSMGIACADYNNDGHFDLYVTNFEGVVNDLYENVGGALFRARNSALGLDATARPLLAFGAVFADFDLDGWSDLFVANGHIWDLRQVSEAAQFEMPPHLFRNLGGKRFVDVAQTTPGAYFQGRWLGRAVAAGDLDNDGDCDLVVTHELKPAAILRNDTVAAGGSLRLRLIGRESARQPLGIRLEWVVEGKRRVTLIPSGGSFQSTSDDRVILSTGQADRLDELRVRWPNGTWEVWKDVKFGKKRGVILLEGTGVRSAIRKAP